MDCRIFESIDPNIWSTELYGYTSVQVFTEIEAREFINTSSSFDDTPQAIIECAEQYLADRKAGIED